MTVIWKNVILILVSVLVIAPLSSAYDNKVEILSVTGSVEVLPNGGVTWMKAGIGMMLRRGDRIKTGASSACDLSFDSKCDNVVGILENSDVLVLLLGSERVELIDANIYAKLSNLKGTSFEVRTPTAVCGARGTGAGVKGNTDSTEATAYENSIYVRNTAGEEKTIEEGFLRKIDKTGRISEQTEAIVENIEKFQSWHNGVDEIVRSSERAESRKIDGLADKLENIVERTEGYSEKSDDKKVDARDETSVSSREDTSGGGGQYIQR